MKRYIILIASLVAMSAVAQSPIESILQSVADNNNNIKATQQDVSAAQTELSAENCLENTSFEFEYLWAEKQVPGGNKYGFSIMQGFDFPTVYGQRRKLINAQNALGASQINYVRQSVLLEARNLYIKIVYLNKQIELVAEREKIARSLVDMYKTRLETGDANRLEVNKVEIDRLSQSSQLKMLINERQAALADLVACNGGMTLPISAKQMEQYPIMTMPASLEEVAAQWQEADANINMIRKQQQVAESFSAVSKEGWIPKFELGYKQAYEVGDMFYGLAVGVSLPLFKTSNEVKTAQACALSLSLQSDVAKAELNAEVSQLYNEATTLSAALEDYTLLTEQNNRELLVKALQAGQISLIEYMSDIAQLNEAEENRLMLEYQYYLALSNLDRNNL
ncbi:MAG: TolC family protein [Bacteroidaceae bacterium]|nr:TolC family protein [Bacteroidaceae bacterium]